MIPNDQPLRKQTIDRMINVCDDKEDLTEWERDFVISLRDQMRYKEDLSFRQCEILERIYDK